MITYHPDSKFLTDFAAANLPLSQATCVATHLEYCGKCRTHIQQLTDLGGFMFSQLEPVVVENDGFTSLMHKIDLSAQTLPLTEAALQDRPLLAGKEHVKPQNAGFLPVIVRKLANGGLHKLDWVQLGSSLRVAPVKIGADKRETAIYDIKAGGKMPEHEHRGEEITVILKGSFSDLDGKYSSGDFVVRNAGEKHQPIATQDTDCICLVCLERPIKPKSWWYRLLEPYVQYQLSRLTGQNLSAGL